MKFLITNTVPLNGGDEALLRALIWGLRLKWPDSSITVLCKDLERCRKQLSDIDLRSDLEFAKEEDRSQVIGCYKSADIVISAPGGFLHDHYAVEERLKGFELALELNKPIVLLAQSIGPFWKTDSIKRVRQVLNRVTCICVRDEISRGYLLKCGVDASRITVTADLAFLWHRIAPELFTPKLGAEVQLVGLSFRPWPLGDQASLEMTITKAMSLCESILSRESRRILFLSTCQGIAGYVDDSEIGATVLARLPGSLRNRCDLDRARYSPTELIRQLGRCDAFIGMRLHACLLAMFAGVPAMGLGYEDKTAQIYSQMGLDDYQVRFDTPVGDWIAKANFFFARVESIRRELPGILDKRCEAALRNLKIVEEVTTGQRSVPMTPHLRWSQSVQRYGRPHLRLRQVAALVNECCPSRMLDIGCATGHLRLLCPSVEYFGCDFVAPVLPAEFAFLQCDFNREPLPAVLRDFDVIVCSGILEYIDDVPAFLDGLRSRLRPDGHLVLTYFNMNHLSRIWTLARGRSFPVHPDWRGFHSIGAVRQILEKSGFEVTRSVAMNHSLGGAPGLEQTLATPLSLPRFRRWSALFAHQALFVAKKHITPEVQRIVNEIPAEPIQERTELTSAVPAPTLR